MIVFAITTSTDSGSLALLKNGNLFAHSAWSRQTQGGEIVTMKVKSLLRQKSLKATDISLIAVDRGPGSFTGCRIAASIAKTLSHASNLPIISRYSLDLMAEAALTNPLTKQGGRIIALLDAHKSLLYGRWYDVKNGVIIEQTPEIRAAEPAEILDWAKDKTLVIGQLTDELRKNLKARGARFLSNTAANKPQAKVLAVLAHAAYINDGKGDSDWMTLEPAYIRAPDAVEKLRG